MSATTSSSSPSYLHDAGPCIGVVASARNMRISPASECAAFNETKMLGEPVVIVNHLCKQYTIPGCETRVSALQDIHLSEDCDYLPIRMSLFPIPSQSNSYMPPPHGLPRGCPLFINACCDFAGRGEFVILRGPSGGGKTTLLNILGTLDGMTSGSLELLGNKIDANTPESLLASMRLGKIGFVFQTFNLLGALSAFENIELPMTLLGRLTRAERAARATELLAAVGLSERATHLPSELSGGEQQRVTIARALANWPELLLLDEPTGDLDSRNTVEIMDLLLRINLEQRTTCIMVTHNPDVESYADRLLYIQDGRFAKQAINVLQVPLVYSDYAAYLASKDGAKGS